MAIRLSDRFSYGRLARFALPSIAMMIFISIYSMVDGLFVSNFTGKEALAAVNLVYPLAMALGSIGFMFGTGGAALVAKTMGEGDEVRANRLFTVSYTHLDVYKRQARCWRSCGPRRAGAAALPWCAAPRRRTRPPPSARI